MKLYDMTLSGNAYKVRLLLSLLRLECELIPVDLASGANRAPDFLAINPRGQVPVLVDGDTTVWDSQAILWHLAASRGDGRWLPGDPASQVQLLQWLAVAGNECLFGLARARATRLFGRDFDLASCQAYGQRGLTLFDEHLANRDWLVGANATIADIACYPYIALAEEADVRLDPYTHVLRWMGRIEELPGYIEMPGLRRVT